MGLIALLIALAVLYNEKIPAGLQRDAWYSDWYSSLTYLPRGLPRLLVGLALPVIGLDLLLRFVDGWVFGLVSLAVAVAVLLYSFGRGDVVDDITALADDAENEDMQGVYHRVEALSGQTGAPELDGVDDATLSGQVVNALSYRFMEHVFAVVFWFFVLGPAAALLYRLLWLSAQAKETDLVESTDQSTAEDTDMVASDDVGENPKDNASLARNWLYWAEWLPVRALGLILAVVGNFGSCVETWLESLVSTESSPSLLGAFVSTSFTPDSADADASVGSRLATQLRSLESLFFRCALAWLVFVAVVTVSF
ncbi:MAG: regulatory signaling modulator protein AmpE [Porticoccaceae bacterium]|nr:regulatory signaling modulator protein AmpE [Porticoccaceae bacterium]